MRLMRTGISKLPVPFAIMVPCFASELDSRGLNFLLWILLVVCKVIIVERKPSDKFEVSLAAFLGFFTEAARYANEDNQCGSHDSSYSVEVGGFMVSRYSCRRGECSACAAWITASGTEGFPRLLLQ